MSRFGSDPHEFFDAVYREAAPWDLGATQPAVVALIEDYPPEGPVLDVGCGTGDLALHLAARGLETLGVDFVGAAIARAEQKRRSAPSHVQDQLTLRIADALHPATLGMSFRAVADSGFYHLFEPAQCREYVRELASVLPPGGRCYLHEFATGFSGPNLPREVTELELRAHFKATSWQFLALRFGEFLSRVGTVPAILACVERVGRTNA
jgi:ubiquinone/menaquinone biosynthesis C-methylase UbiE